MSRRSKILKEPKTKLLRKESSRNLVLALENIKKENEELYNEKEARNLIFYENITQKEGEKALEYNFGERFGSSFDLLAKGERVINTGKQIFGTEYILIIDFLFDSNHYTSLEWKIYRLISMYSTTATASNFFDIISEKQDIFNFLKSNFSNFIEKCKAKVKENELLKIKTIIEKRINILEKAQQLQNFQQGVGGSEEAKRGKKKKKLSSGMTGGGSYIATAPLVHPQAAQTSSWFKFGGSHSHRERSKNYVSQTQTNRSQGPEHVKFESKDDSSTGSESEKSSSRENSSSDASDKLRKGKVLPPRAQPLPSQHPNVLVMNIHPLPFILPPPDWSAFQKAYQPDKLKLIQHLDHFNYEFGFFPSSKSSSSSSSSSVNSSSSNDQSSLLPPSHQCTSGLVFTDPSSFSTFTSHFDISNSHADFPLYQEKISLRVFISFPSLHLPLSLSFSLPFLSFPLLLPPSSLPFPSFFLSLLPSLPFLLTSFLILLPFFLFYLPIDFMLKGKGMELGLNTPNFI